MAKTYYLEKFGIRVDGCRNKTEARKQWEMARDEYVDRSTACPPWVFAFDGHTVVVTAEPHANSWSYTIVKPGDSGKKHGSCFYNAPSQIAAIAIALGALAQAAWSIDIDDDSEWFDHIVASARLIAQEAAHERSSFVTVAAHWRKHQLAA